MLFMQEMVSISSVVSFNDALAARDWCKSNLKLAVGWLRSEALLALLEEEIVRSAVCSVTNRLLLSDPGATAVLESQFHCPY